MKQTIEEYRLAKMVGSLVFRHNAVFGSNSYFSNGCYKYTFEMSPVFTTQGMVGGPAVKFGRGLNFI